MPLKSLCQGFGAGGAPTADTSLQSWVMTTPSPGGNTSWVNNLVVKRLDLSFTDTATLELVFGRFRVPNNPNGEQYGSPGNFFRGNDWVVSTATQEYAVWAGAPEVYGTPQPLGQYFLAPGVHEFEFPERIEALWHPPGATSWAFGYTIQRTDGVEEGIPYHLNLWYDEY